MNITVEKKHNEKKTFALTIISLIVAIVIFSLSRTEILTNIFWQGTGVLFFGISFLYIYKFHMTDYTYTLTDDSFIIVKAVGKKTTKVCHLDNEMITLMCSAKDWKKNKKNRRIACVYNYNASLSPEEGYVLLFELSGNESAVKFEASREMADAINKIIRDRKENQ